jgi:hypothetical protein
MLDLGDLLAIPRYKEESMTIKTAHWKIDQMKKFPLKNLTLKKNLVQQWEKKRILKRIKLVVKAKTRKIL